jgi:hypothetical protein
MTNQERNTILAALRYYADAGQGEPNNRSALIHEIATGEGTEYEDVSLDTEGIEQLIYAWERRQVTQA